MSTENQQTVIPEPVHFSSFGRNLAILRAEIDAPAAPVAEEAPRKDPVSIAPVAPTAKVPDTVADKPPATTAPAGDEFERWDDDPTTTTAHAEEDEIPPEDSPEAEAERIAAEQGKKPFWRERLDKKNERIALEQANAAAARQEAEQLRAQLAALQQGQPVPAPQPVVAPAQAPQEIDQAQLLQYIATKDPEAQQLAARVQEIQAHPEKFATQGEFTAALVAASTTFETSVRLKAQAIIGQHQAEQARQVAVQTAQQTAESQTLQALAKNYDTKIAESTIPNAQIYAERLVRRANEIHPEIRRAILEHPDPALATAALTSSKEEFAWFAQQSARNVGKVPVVALARLGEVISNFRNRTSPAVRQEAEKKQEQTLPPVPRSAPSKTTGATEKDPFKNARAVLAGEKKKDW